MFNSSTLRICGLSELKRWRWHEGAFSCIEAYDYRVIFCDITIDGREVRSWDQPLFAATGKALFALACMRNRERGWEYIVQVKEESGCFDRAEFGPTVQLEHSQRADTCAAWDVFLLEKIKMKRDLLYAVALSEEGGRFYQEENENYIVEISEEEAAGLPGEEQGYFYLTLNELFTLNITNNVLNIQLRNLLSLLESRPMNEGERSQ